MYFTGPPAFYLFAYCIVPIQTDQPGFDRQKSRKASRTGMDCHLANVSLYLQRLNWDSQFTISHRLFWTAVKCDTERPSRTREQRFTSNMEIEMEPA